VGRVSGVTPQQIRARLLEAACTVFSLKGYEGATVGDIAREAGLSSGAIYSQFPSKARLLVESVRARRQEVGRSLFPPGGRRGLTEHLVVLARRLNRPRGGGDNLLAEALLGARRDAELAAVLAGALAESEKGMAALVRSGQQAGEIRVGVRAEAVARLALMLGVGALFVRELGLDPLPGDDWSALADLLVGAIGPGVGPGDVEGGPGVGPGEVEGGPGVGPAIGGGAIGGPAENLDTEA